MKHDDLNDILSRDQNIVPSSGFVSAVMDAVREDAQAPPAIPFPWGRALPGIAAAAVAFVLVAIQGFKTAPPTPQTTSLVSGFADRLAIVLDSAQMSGVTWMLLGLLLTLGCAKLSFYLARRV
jgi:hypothetical protein